MTLAAPGIEQGEDLRFEDTVAGLAVICDRGRVEHKHQRQNTGQGFAKSVHLEAVNSAGNWQPEWHRMTSMYT
jgi:hypothetical protein